MLNNRSLRAELRELGIERGMLIDARTLANPQFEVEAQPERNSSVELRVEYEISELIFAPLRAKVARFELDAARHRVAASVVALGYEVRAAFYEFQAADQRLKLAQRRLDARAAARDAALALREAENINELASATRIAAYERSRLGVADLELEWAGARETLHRWLGVHGADTQWALGSELPALPEQEPELTGIENSALSSSLVLAGHRSKLEALARRTGLERAQGWLSHLSLDYHALVGNPLSRSDSSGSEVRSGAGLSLSIPIFDRNRGKTRATEAAFDGLLERYFARSVDLRSRAREVGNRLRQAYASARHLATNVVPAQHRVLDETLLQYNAMQIGIFDLLAAQEGVLEVELAELNARANYWKAHAGYQALLAGADPRFENQNSNAGLDFASGQEQGH
jgi:outer membrane protein TolC